MGQTAASCIGTERRPRQHPRHEFLEARSRAPGGAADAQSPARLQHTCKLAERAGLFRQPVEDGVEADDVESGARDDGQVVGVGDLELQIGPRLGPGKLDAQRQRIDAQHGAGRADQIGDMLGQKASAAADVEHALAGRDGELPDQKLAGLELTAGADKLVVARQLLVVLSEQWSTRQTCLRRGVDRQGSKFPSACESVRA